MTDADRYEVESDSDMAKAVGVAAVLESIAESLRHVDGDEWYEYEVVVRERSHE